MTVEITVYSEADEAEVVTLWEQCFAGNLTGHNEPRGAIARKLAFQRELFFVAKLEGRVVGTTMAGYDGHRGWMYSVAVHPNERRQGIGRRLLDHAEAALIALGCPKINLHIRPSNTEVIEFYQHCGYGQEQVLCMGKRTG